MTEKLTEMARVILLELSRVKRVEPNRFDGSGFVVMGLVRRGLAEWIRRGNDQNATGLRITRWGRAALTAANQETNSR